MWRNWTAQTVSTRKAGSSNLSMLTLKYMTPLDRFTYLIDFDDTLVRTSPLYESAFNHLAAFVVHKTSLAKGLPGDNQSKCQKVIQIARAIDSGAAQRALEFHRERFPQSFEATLDALGAMCGEEPSKSEKAEANQIGAAVFKGVAPLFSDALAFMNALPFENVYIYTLGDMSVQAQRLHDVKLNRFNYRVTPAKTTANLKDYLNLIGASHRTIYIGDSWKNDIIPANECGLWPIWIDRRGDGEGYDETHWAIHVHSLTQALDAISRIRII